MGYTALLSFFVVCLSSLFTIISPLGTASVFLSITRGDSAKKRRKYSRKACIAAAIAMILFAIGGSYILKLFNVTVDAFRIAGGLLIVTYGFNMIYAKRKRLKSPEEHKEARTKEDVSLVPLAIPLLAGPGALTTSLVLMGSASSPAMIAVLFASIVLVCVLTYWILVEAVNVDKYLGATGRSVADKIMGLIVLVIGIQFFINGIEGILILWNVLPR